MNNFCIFFPPTISFLLFLGTGIWKISPFWVGFCIFFDFDVSVGYIRIYEKFIDVWIMEKRVYHFLSNLKKKYSLPFPLCRPPFAFSLPSKHPISKRKLGNCPSMHNISLKTRYRLKVPFIYLFFANFN